MPKSEELLLEAVKNMLKCEPALGLSAHNDPETSHLFQYNWEDINDAFSLKCINSPFHQSLTSAFYEVHTYKYVNDPSFTESFQRSMRARAIPEEQQKDAFENFDKVLREFGGDGLPADERFTGWNPNLEEIVELTTNADTKGVTPSKPFTGGGPAPADNEIG